MKTEKIKVSIVWILILIIILMIVAPIYPCKVKKTVAGGAGAPEITNTIWPRPIYEVLSNNFNWSYLWSAIGASVLTEYSANPIFLLLYPGILIGIVLIMYNSNKDTFRTGYIEFKRKRFSLLIISLTLSLIILSLLSVILWYLSHWIDVPVSYWIILCFSFIVGIIYIIWMFAKLNRPTAREQNGNDESAR